MESPRLCTATGCLGAQGASKGAGRDAPGPGGIITRQRGIPQDKDVQIQTQHRGWLGAHTTTARRPFDSRESGDSQACLRVLVPMEPPRRSASLREHSLWRIPVHLASCKAARLRKSTTRPPCVSDRACVKTLPLDWSLTCIRWVSTFGMWNLHLKLHVDVLRLGYGCLNRGDDGKWGLEKKKLKITGSAPKW